MIPTRDLLAEELLAKVMKWKPEEIAIERPDLQALATFKYDDYQQYFPGMRFLESLAQWLFQFEKDDERKLAYNFVRSRLVFISNNELSHLVRISYPDYIRPFLIKKTASINGIHEIYVTNIYKSKEYKMLLRKSLFLGLSDGARIDIFRRCNPEITHEQTWQVYEISDSKATDLLDNLSLDLEKIISRKPTESENKFNTIFLIDDFSGSGISYIRHEDSNFNGKIFRILNNVYNDIVLNRIVNLDDLDICIVLYVATNKALSHIRVLTNEWITQNHSSVRCTINAIQTLPDEIAINEHNTPIIDILSKYFDDSIINRHYRKGLHTYPFLGFDHCGLPLVLAHNTPNNSLPILWFEEFRKYKGLFPRVSRHGG